MSDAATMVRYVDAAQDDILATVWAYEIPGQSEWTYIEDTAYKVYDVIHTVFPNRERMVSTVLLWEPNPEATDDAITNMYEQSVAARN